MNRIEEKKKKLSSLTENYDNDKQFIPIYNNEKQTYYFISYKCVVIVCKDANDGVLINGIDREVQW